MVYLCHGGRSVNMMTTIDLTAQIERFFIACHLHQALFLLRIFLCHQRHVGLEVALA